MAKAETKTRPTLVSPAAYIDSLDDAQRRTDGEVLLKWFAAVTGLKPRMWGPSLIGYGRYRYQYDSGRKSEMLITGFSPRKASLVLYIMPGYRDMSGMLARLGRHKAGKSCLYINKLSASTWTSWRRSCAMVSHTCG